MYPGGKNGAGVYQRIINLMPPHEVYIEAFLGGAAIMRHKRPALVNIGIDLDPAALEQARCSISGADDAGRRFRFVLDDAIRFLATYEFTGQTLLYCDPPYLPTTRRSSRPIYKHEMTAEQHARLLATLATIQNRCAIMISGYWSKLYERYLGEPPWHSTNYQAMTRGGHLATETLWFNFPKPTFLHDYQFLGTDFRERERIKRKKARWTARLRRLPVLERQALLAAIEESNCQDASPEAAMSADAAGSSDTTGSLAGIDGSCSARRN